MNSLVGFGRFAVTQRVMGRPTAACPQQSRAQIARDEVLLLGVYVGLTAVVIGLSLAGGGSLARIVYMGAGLLVAALTHRRSPWLFVSATLWFWLFTSFARRMLEWKSGFQTGDLVLLTPNLMALFILYDLVGMPGLLRRPNIGYPLTMFACVLAGVAVSLFQGQILPAAASATDWIIPVLYLFHFIAYSARIGEAESHFATFLPLSLLFVVPYAIYQWFLMPPWDAMWMLGSGMGSVGNPLPMGSKVFGSFNNSGFLAIWCATCIVLVSHFRSLIALSIMPLTFFVVALAQVRAVYGSLFVAIIASALLGRGGFGRMIILILISLGTLYLSAAVLDPKVVQQIDQRFASFNDISDDNSAVERIHILDQAPTLIAANPLGVGIGAQGRGAGAESNDPSKSLNVDNGVLSIILALGWLPGTLYLATMAAAFVRAFAAGRRYKSPAAAVMSAAALCALGTLPFLNVIGFEGVTMWSCIGFALATDAAGRMPKHAQSMRAAAMA